MRDNPIDALLSLGFLDPVRLRFGDEERTTHILSKRVDDEQVVVLVGEPGGDRAYVIESRWIQGWVEPLVDVFDVAVDDPEFEPLGVLSAIERVEEPPSVTLWL